jgi:hypothetical protein
MVYSRAERMFILEHNTSHKKRLLLFVKHLAMRSPSKTTIHRLVTKFRVDACLREGGGHFQHLL